MPEHALNRRSVLAALCVGLAAVMLSGGCVSHPGPRADAPRALLVMTNHAELGETGEATGAYLSEVAHPWQVFTESGFVVTLASPEGGAAPLDPRSLADSDEASRAFLDRFAAEGSVPGTVALGAVEPAAYDIVFFAGGHGTMWDFPEHADVRRVAEGVYAHGGVVGAVCHGPAALVSLRGADGGALVQGRRVAAFTDAEEAAVELTEAMPFLLETRLRELGANVVTVPNFQENVVADGRLVTGQNPASAEGAAKAAVARVLLDR